MTRNEAREFMNSLLSLRASATDEQAVEAPAVYPIWREGIQYKIEDRILYNKTLYRVITEHISQTDWAPDAAVSLFTKILIPDENIIYPWEQPESTNPYMKGDKVSYNGKIYECLIDYNTYSPIDYPFGWQEIE